MIAHRVVSRASQDSHAERYLRALYGVTVGISPFRFILFGFMLVAVGTLLNAFAILMVLRYVAGEFLARHPILYLRSFQHETTQIVYARWINEVAQRFGVVMGLVHTSQKQHETL